MIEIPIAPAAKEDPHKWDTARQFNEKRDTIPSTDVDKGQIYPRHDLLGSRVLESNGADPSWQSILAIRNIPWLAEHILLNQIAFPAAGYIAMAGESMRQVYDGNLESYALRDFSITSALLLRPDDEIKLFTRLRPVNVAGDTGLWYEMQITSHDGTRWIERCVSKVSPRSAPSSLATDMRYSKDAPQRHIAQAYWYDVIADSGLKYGSAFQGLDEISASLTEQKAIATISPFEDTSKYILHPVTIDQCLQVLMVAACRGQGRQLGGLSVITSIQRLIVSNGEQGKLRAGGMGTRNESGGLTGDVSAISENGHSVLSIKGCETSLVPNDMASSENKLFSIVKWDTDPTYLNLNRALMPFDSRLDPSILLERLTLLCLLDSRGYAGAPGQVHLQDMHDTVTSKKEGKFGLISDTSPFTELDAPIRRSMLQLLKTQINGTTLASLGALVERILTSSTPISEDIAERKSLLDECHPLVRNGGILADTLKLLAHKTPKLRILEFGNGADSTTRLVQNVLKSQYGEHMYSAYTYAATSLDATSRARATFKEASDINVIFFDVEKQLQSQSIQAKFYDLIITTDFIAPARNVKVCVDQLRQLINPLGRLLLLDTLPEPAWTSLIKNHLSDSPQTQTCASQDDKFISQVHTTLLESGFVFGSGDNSSFAAPKVVAELKKPLSHPKKITLLVPARHHPLVNAIQISFQKGGVRCDRRTLQDDIPEGQDIVSIVDFSEPYVYNITEARFRDFANRLSNFKGSMIWVTPAAQISCDDPNSSMVLGLTRTLRSELKKDITVVEIDVEAATYLSSCKSLLKIYQGLSHRPRAKDVDPDFEYAIVDGEIKIPRIHWTSGEEELSDCARYLTTDESASQSLQAPNAHSPLPIRFRTDAYYLLVGGLGGLGRLISTWMVENGARHILFLSRSAKEGPETTPFFDELRSQGCEVSTFAGSVTDISDVEAAVKQATKPLAGIMQMSALMRDNWMSQMTFTEWDQCIRPKVHGTWNLHHATSPANLDFFLLFSSICGITGQWGQGNYNAANAFLDAFVPFRHGRDLPASVVDIGFMGSVGMAMENRALVDKLKGSGYHFLGEKDLIDALTVAIVNSRPRQRPNGENRDRDGFVNKSQLGLGFRSTKPITHPATRVVWKKDARMAVSHQFGALGPVTDEEAREALRAAYRGRKE